MRLDLSPTQRMKVMSRSYALIGLVFLVLGIVLAFWPAIVGGAVMVLLQIALEIRLRKAASTKTDGADDG